MKDKFYFDQSEASFIGNIQILKNNIELEIKIKESELNWGEVEKFVSSLESDNFSEIIDASTKLLLEFIKLVPFGVNQPYNAYDFRLEAIVYYGEVDNRIFSGLVDGFELVFKLYHSDYIECYAPYVNYIVRIENRLIMGVRYHI